MANINFFTLYRRLLRLVPSSGIAVVCRDTDPETGQTWKAKDFYEPLGIVKAVREACTHKGEVDVDALISLSTFDNLKQALADSYLDQGIQVMLIGYPAEAEAYEAEEERKRLERKASALASSLGVQADSFEFIEALENRMQSERDHRFGMREDGLCIGFGVAPEQWFDDFNYSQAQEAGYEEILRFLDTYCPLLMAQYRERKLSEKSVQASPSDAPHIIM